MGLMLSVLVFFVGVVEVLDCWHNFLLHLVQPQYKSIIYHPESKSKSDLLNARSVHTPVELSRHSHVDICWPKDLSPTDDLHVIKKRAHLESERSLEQDDDSPRRRSKGKISHHEHDINSSDASCKNVPLETTVPQIVVHRSEIDNPIHQESPTCSRESSPNYLELSVIVESDSSSELDEPSQIENPEYKKRKEAELASKPHEELVGNPQQVCTIAGRGVHDQEVPLSIKCEDVPRVPRPDSPFPLREDPEIENDKQSGILEIEHPNNFDVPVLTDLPIFTNTIISKNIMKISCQYPSDIVQSDNSVSNHVDHNALDIADVSDFHKTVNLEVVKLSENVEQEQEIEGCPEIMLSESSPVSNVEDSDSSLNTSDASWMVKSKTSDRPLKIRFPPPEKTVTKDELKSLVNCETSTENISKKTDQSVSFYDQAPLELKLEVMEFVDEIIEKALAYTSNEKFDDVDILNNCDIIICDSTAQNEKDCDTNSSSSSLSGIPQLPEDIKDIIYINMPSHNGIGPHSLGEESLETSYSVYDNFVQPLPFSEAIEGKNYLVRTQSSASIAGRNVCNDVNRLVLTHSSSSPVLLRTTSENQKEEYEDVDNNKNLFKSTSHSNCDRGKKIDSDAPSSLNVQQENVLKGIIECSEENKSVEKDKAETHTSKSTKFPESKDAVLLCRAKESKENECVKSAALVRTGPLPGPGPSYSPVSDTPSTSKAGNAEDKAFWLIFSGEYTKAMNKDWHSGHFCCWQCDESLTGQRYVLRDEHPYCIKCYESVFANGCEECNKTIGIDSKDLSYKDKHWHEACFLCNKCRVSLVDKQFGSKLDKIFCGNCYDAQFASRCDGCGQIFKAGTKKMEYKTRQWHEPCFACCVCKSPIGTKSFIPREQEIYCATCYEEKFATRCVKCNKIITSGGVTYKNEPWHRECFTCTNCNTSLAGQRFTSKEEKPYCADCFGELFAKRCTACCKPITGIGGTRFVSFEDRHWHNDCFSCASCKTSLVGRGFITDGDDIICPECAKQKLM